MAKEKKLQGGLLPAGVQCYWHASCPFITDCAAGTPEGNKVDFSCGMARFFDIFGEPSKEGVEWLKGMSEETNQPEKNNEHNIK